LNSQEALAFLKVMGFGLSVTQVQERAAQFDPNQVEEKAGHLLRSARSVHQYHADRVYSGGSSFSTTGRRFKTPASIHSHCPKDSR